MQAAWLALPRREQYFWPSGQIYAEAESNANEFAFGCFNRSGSMFRACFAACFARGAGRCCTGKVYLICDT